MEDVRETMKSGTLLQILGWVKRGPAMSAMSRGRIRRAREMKLPRISFDAVSVEFTSFPSTFKRMSPT